jgi:hypothetical protein
MIEPDALATLLKAGDVYVLSGAFIYWAWRSDRRFVAIETTLTHLLRKG